MEMQQAMGSSAPYVSAAQKNTVTELHAYKCLTSAKLKGTMLHLQNIKVSTEVTIVTINLGCTHADLGVITVHFHLMAALHSVKVICDHLRYTRGQVAAHVCTGSAA